MVAPKNQISIAFSIASAQYLISFGPKVNDNFIDRLSNNPILDLNLSMAMPFEDDNMSLHICSLSSYKRDKIYAIQTQLKLPYSSGLFTVCIDWIIALHNKFPIAIYDTD